LSGPCQLTGRFSFRLSPFSAVYGVCMALRAAGELGKIYLKKILFKNFYTKDSPESLAYPY
jgi:hypothetical protein